MSAADADAVADAVANAAELCALATWAGPVRAAFDIPAPYRLICGVAMGYASAQAVNGFNPGRAAPGALQLAPRQA